MPVNCPASEADTQNSSQAADGGVADVLRYANCDQEALSGLVAPYGLLIEEIARGNAIPGSFWGDEEAGLIGSRVIVRPDTPVHSVLHEACHYVCMDPQRRTGLHTNAGGDYDEENAVCYLQIALAGLLPELGKAGMWRDMDRWGYTFRLGSARAWYEQDAAGARDWLTKNGILSSDGDPTGALWMGEQG